MLRVPLADGTLVSTPDVPSDDLLPSLLATSDVLGTGWFAAVAANVKPGSTVSGFSSSTSISTAVPWRPTPMPRRPVVAVRIRAVRVPPIQTAEADSG